jgi:hypothetical protein
MKRKSKKLKNCGMIELKSTGTLKKCLILNFD